MRISGTSNPILSGKAFSVETSGQPMTIQGTVNKSLILFFIILITGSLSWRLAASNPEMLSALLWPAAIIGFVLAIITTFAKKWSMILAPLYAAAQGFFLGAISMVYNQFFTGIVIQAVLLTVGILGIMLFAYKTKIIVPTQKFRSGIIIATGGIALVYIVTMILNLFGVNVPFIHDSGPIGIGISLFIVIIAALNLILDFSFIEEVTAIGAPKYMEWYAAFGLMVTLIWLYLEILRLLSKLRD